MPSPRSFGGRPFAYGRERRPLFGIFCWVLTGAPPEPSPGSPPGTRLFLTNATTPAPPRLRGPANLQPFARARPDRTPRARGRNCWPLGHTGRPSRYLLPAIPTALAPERAAELPNEISHTGGVVRASGPVIHLKPPLFASRAWPRISLCFFGTGREGGPRLWAIVHQKPRPFAPCARGRI